MIDFNDAKYTQKKIEAELLSRVPDTIDKRPGQYDPDCAWTCGLVSGGDLHVTGARCRKMLMPVVP